MLVVRDLEAARRRFAAMGFATTPMGLHSGGTANHLLMFRQTYVELLGVAEGATDTPALGLLRAWLSLREGVMMTALLSTDPDHDAADLRARGLSPMEGELHRDVTLPGGGGGRADIRIMVTWPDGAPFAGVLLSHQADRRLVWVPDWQAQPNGVVDLSVVTYVAEYPAALTAHHRSLLGEAAVTATADGGSAETAFGRLDTVTPAAFAARFGGVDWPGSPLLPHVGALTLETTDTDPLRGRLAAAGIPFVDTEDGRVIVRPDDAFGTLLEFCWVGRVPPPPGQAAS